jgi:hypothetical protein
MFNFTFLRVAKFTVLWCGTCLAHFTLSFIFSCSGVQELSAPPASSKKANTISNLTTQKIKSPVDAIHKKRFENLPPLA